MKILREWGHLVRTLLGKIPKKWGIPLALFLLVGLARILTSPEPGGESVNGKKPMEQASLTPRAQSNRPFLAPDVPLDRVPDYRIKGFTYLSTVGGVKQWKLEAEQSALFNEEELVHAQKIKAYLYDDSEAGTPTIITGKEAQYYTGKRDLEIFGDVVAILPDGFKVVSQYLQYLPEKKRIVIPAPQGVAGESAPEDGRSTEFTAGGMDYQMGENAIDLHQDVVFTMTQIEKKPHSPGVAEKTVIRSDRANIDRTRQLAIFQMFSKRPLKQRFVRMTQPNLYVQSRHAELNYGDYEQLLHYLIAYEDVLIRELGGDEILRYGTCGKALFSTRRNIIELTEFPQVYQDQDTVTGDRILIHRDSDIVEVDHSNAFSEGKTK